MELRRDKLDRFISNKEAPVISCSLCSLPATHLNISYLESSGWDTIGNLCSECFYNRCFVCAECGASKDRYYFREGDVCTNCYAKKIKKGVNSAGLKPTPIFKGDGPRYLGFELEIMNSEMEYPCDSKLDTAADTLRAVTQERVYCKGDGSITGPGFEIVSHPATLDWYQENEKLFDPIFDLRNDGYRSDSTSCCGLHIHISRASLPTATLYRMLRFSFSNIEWMQSIAQRGDGIYHSWTKQDEPQIKDKSERACGCRSCAINTSNKITIELRMFKGTLDKALFWKGMEMADALPAFAEAGYGINESTQDFKEWLLNKENRSRYQNLNNFIAVENL